MHTFAKQVSSDVFLQDLLFVVATMAVIVALLGLGLIDMGFVRRKNVLETWIQKLVAASCAGFGMALIGIPIWNWQYNQAFGVHNSFWQSVTDWWFGGHFLTHFAANINPSTLPDADVYQVFFGFFVTFAMVAGALLAGGVLERLKPVPLYIMSFVLGAVVNPFVAYLTWGSTSPLTNHGLHDYAAVMGLYIVVGTWSLIVAWRVGPRLGAFVPHRSGSNPSAHNLGLSAAGVLLLVFSVPFIVLGSGYLIPGEGYFGISFTTSGVGIVLCNILAAFIAGGLSGAVIAYRRKEPIWAIFGPLAGYVMTGTLLDVGMPWYVFLVALAGPPIALAAYELIRKAGIDEPKVAPLALGPGVVGVIVTGFVAWHTKTGGYPGLTGKYAFQHAEITPLWQLIGVVATLVVAAVSALVLCWILERTTGLRVSEETEIAGLDISHWEVQNFDDEQLTLPADEEPVVIGR